MKINRNIVLLEVAIGQISAMALDNDPCKAAEEDYEPDEYKGFNPRPYIGNKSFKSNKRKQIKRGKR